MTVRKKRTGRPVEPVELTADEKETLERWARGRTVSQGLAMRAEIVLLCARGKLHRTIARRLRITIQTVGRWRKRFARYRVEGLSDLPRPNVHRKLSDERLEELVRTTLQTKPEGATHWSTRKLARKLGVSQSTVSRVWRAFQLKPHRRRTFTLSTDEFFVEKVRDIVGLYLNPPDHAVVLCLDEKSQIQALERRQPLLPLVFGQPERATATYNRHGTTNLFAALDVATGRVIGECYPRKRAVEFRRFLERVDAEVPSELDVHVVVDNSSIHGAPTIRRWLQKHARFHLHFTPTYSSWLNLVERWFAKLTDEALRRGNHINVRELRAAIETYIAASNEERKPFVWTKTADEILASVARFCAHTLEQADC
jgi:transposase